jgi:hypothetical protein
MKKLLGGLKPKELFLNHGEKIAFGTGILLVLLVLAGTEWSRYAKTPQEIISKVQDTKKKIASSVWPADKQATFGLQDYSARAQEVRGPLQIGRYEYSTNMWWPLYRKQELAKEPELIPVADLIATPGRMSFGIMPKMETGNLVAGADGQATTATAPTNEIDDDFAPVAKGAGLGAAGQFGAGGSLAETAGALNPALGAASPDIYGSSDGAMMGGMVAPAMSSRGERFIAIRGVWPIWQQMEKFQRALNLQSTSDARNYLQLLDFVLERQTAVAGSDPWTGPWDVVDSQRAIDVLMEAYDFAYDPVDPQITDVTITMPLPARLVGQWGDLATHPKILNYVLPPAEQERQRKLEEKLNEEFEKYQMKVEARRVEPKGFSKVQRNIRSMAETMFAGGGEYVAQIESDFNAWAPTDASVRMTLPDLKNRLQAVGRLMLFRYFDFDVRPGYAYRYRVRLKLRNPNFERPLDQVVDASVAEGTERETPNSSISNVAVVPDSVNFFLREVDRDPVNEQRSTISRPLARLDFFEWDATVGTMIKDTVELTTYGQFISEKKKSLKLDVAGPSFKDAEVTFRSDDLLLDAIADPKLDTEIHKDLKLPATNRGKAGILGEMLVMDEGGQLRTYDPATNVTKKAELTQYVQRERAPFKDIENKEAQPAGMLDGYGGYPGGEGAGDMGMMPGEMGMMPGGKTKGKKKNPRKMAPGMMMGGSSSGGP